MFERFDDAARQALFFARAHVSVRSGPTIDTGDLLQGVLAVALDDICRVAEDRTAIAALVAPAMRRRDDEELAEFAERISLGGMLDSDMSREVPFDASAKAALESAMVEADALDHHDIRPAHLLLGLLRHEGTPAWQALVDAGVTLRGVRAAMGGASPR